MYIYKKSLPKKEIYGMARVGFTSDNYEIYVNTNDSGSVPYFHYRNANDWTKFHTCIEILNPKYFHHGNKNDTLNSKQIKQLHKFLISKVNIPKYEDKFKNNWELICFLWDINNSSVQIPDDATMPNYLQKL